MVIGVVGFINFIIDPNGIFNAVSIKGFNEHKNSHISDRMSKFYYCNRAKPETVLIGASRIGTVNPDDVRAYTNDKVYNMSLSAATAYEQSEYFKYLVTHHNIKRVILSVDFFTYLPNKLYNEGFVKDRLTKSIYLKDYIDSLFTIKTISRSKKTVIENFNNEPVEIDFSNGWHTYYTSNQKLKVYGERYIEDKIIETIRTYSRENYKNPNFRDINTTKKYLGYLQEMVTIAKQKNIELIVYVSPIHYKQFVLIYCMGLGDTFEEWKRGVATITPFYDFTGYNSVTTENRWWWDTSHINSDGARLILAFIFKDVKHMPPVDFGVYVDTGNVEAHIENLRSKVSQEDIQHIKNIISKKQ